MPGIKMLQKTELKMVVHVYTVWLAMCLVLFPLVLADTTCEDGKFLDVDLDMCITCAGCPDNQIVRIPCSYTADTTCGPFSEFKSFKHSNVETAHTTKEDITSVTVKQQQTTDGQHSNVTWYTITMLLVAVLCITGAFLIALMAITCYFMRKKRKESLLLAERESDQQPETSSSKMELLEVVEET